MKFLFKNTKIVSTFGPSITFDLTLFSDRRDPDVKKTVDKSLGLIESLIFSGINCVRFNFSHGLHDENKLRFLLINEIQKKIVDSQSSNKRKYFRLISFLADTKGPEIRVFDMGEGVKYSRNQRVFINCLEKNRGSNSGFSVVDSTGLYNMANDCIVGNSILLEDGKLEMKIISVDKSSGKVEAEVKNDHFLKTNKRINLPGADYSMDFLSEKDIKDIKYSIDNGFVYIALSFANSSDNVNSVRKLVSDYCKEKNIPNIFKVYSKIETLKSCQNIDSIIDASDGIMIARGDLGLEIPYYEVPYWTKEIIKKCRIKRKPVITATQMLDSLERNVVATRAEVSDVYRAAEMGSDCTMLSGETAQGLFPEVSVQTMTNINFESEKHFNSDKFKKLFDLEISQFLEPNVRLKCEELWKSLKSSNRISAIVASHEDLSEDLISAISSMKISAPLFIFYNVDDVSCLYKDPDWSNSSYVAMKKASGLSLYRSVYPIFYSGLKESLVIIFDEFLKVFCPELKRSSLLVLKEGVWKLEN